MKKIAMVIAKKDFRDEEYQKPRHILEQKGYQVTVFSSSLNVSKGMFGLTVKPDKLINEIEPKEFDAIVFVGGGGSKEYFNNSVALELAKSFYNANKLVSAICIAPLILGNAGLLKGKKVCCFPSVKGDVSKTGADVQPDGVAIDGNIITGTGPEFAANFGNALVEFLEKN